VTLEANPDDVTEQKLAAWLSQGVNRLSIGVQSFDDRLLEMLGRRHSSADAVRAYRDAVEAGFSNVSIDLMYGLPDQTLEDWRRTLEQANALVPPHVSMYCLTLEGGTPMERWVASGRLAEPEPDLAADMYLMAQEVMEREGYGHYEISNWARPGFESRHNLVYWRNRQYLGVGPGAHSYLGAFRFFNIRSPAEYVRRLGSGVGGRHGPSPLTAGSLERMPAVAGVETIDRRLEMAETMMMGLRLAEGIASSDFKRRFGSTPDEEYGAIIGELAGQGLLHSGDAVLKLTPRGRMLGNEVFSRFF
jgi:oxygen-independent coproporphyrinogen-3 oxidase